MGREGEFHMTRGAFMGLAIASLPLAACQTAKAPQVVYRDVKVPTPVYCVKREQLPTKPASIAGQLTGNAGKDIGPVTIAALEWKKTATTALALLEGCIEPEGN